VKAVLSYKKSDEDSFLITIPGSKSESNRLLILQSLFTNLKINNLSTSNDTQKLIQGLKRNNGDIDIHHAGTAMRFLTAFYASKEGVEVSLTGSKRMQERPIKLLVDALINIGAEIMYLKNEGYPPLKIVGKKLEKASLKINADVSSQYITALMLIASSLTKGLKIELQGEITSIPYIEMTLDLLQKIGIASSLKNNCISIESHSNIKDHTIDVESDWSSASYYYSIVALSKNMEITLNYFRKR